MQENVFMEPNHDYHLLNTDRCTCVGALMIFDVHISITTLLLLSIMIIETNIIVKYYLYIYPSGPMSLELSFSRSLVVETVNLSLLIHTKKSRIFSQGS